MSRNKLLILGTGLIVILFSIVLYFLLRDTGRDETEKQEESSHRDPTLERVGDGPIEIVSDDPEEILERYRTWAQYPPYSRPLYSGMVDLTDPFNAERPPVGVIQNPAQGCASGPDGMPKCEKNAELSDVQCEMTPEKSVVVGKHDLKVFLRCFNKEGVNLPVTGITPRIYRMLYRAVYPSLPPISSGDDGANGDVRAGDHIYTFLIRPTSEDWGQMYLEVDMEVKGLRHNQRASWMGTPHIVAQFNTPVQDRLRDGHLIISIPVSIYKAGYYEFEANLQEKNGDQRLVASSTFEGELEAGNRTIEFVFWGKVIRDRHIDGPYVVRQIRGKRNNSPVTPAMVKRAATENKPVPEPRYTEPMWEHIEMSADADTGSYNASEFSTAAWDSKEKQDRIQFLEEMARRQ